MKRVYENTNHVGLRHLCVCMRHDLQGLEYTRTYVNNVLQYCPNLERFDGYRAAVRTVDTRINYEQWCMDMELWTRFCSTLNQLVEFDWIAVPFATRFFEIFGDHPKPKLKTLTLTTPANWKWDTLLRDAVARDRGILTDSGYGVTAKNAHAVLSACPNLTRLAIDWYHQLLHPTAVQATAPPTMNPEIFGDKFWEAAVRRCPQLSVITFLPVTRDDTSATVQAFTDKSLRAIATLPCARYFEAAAVNVTGEGLFDLAVHHATPMDPRRRVTYHISIGDRTTEASDEQFYTAVTRFLEKLLETDGPLPCMTHNASLFVQNLRKTPVEKAWSETYLENLKTLIDQVRLKHPDVVLSVFAKECDGWSFAQITEFSFDTTEELANTWIVSSDAIVGNCLWNRRVSAESGYLEIVYDTDDGDDDDGDAEAHDNDNDGDDGDAPRWLGRRSTRDDEYSDDDSEDDDDANDDDDDVDIDGPW